MKVLLDLIKLSASRCTKLIISPQTMKTVMLFAVSNSSKMPITLLINGCRSQTAIYGVFQAVTFAYLMHWWVSCQYGNPSPSWIFKNQIWSREHRVSNLSLCTRFHQNRAIFPPEIWRFNPLMGTGNYSAHRIIWSWYTGRWWVGCYIWYSDEGTRRGPSPPRPLLAVPSNVTAHPSTASVPTSYYSM